MKHTKQPAAAVPPKPEKIRWLRRMLANAAQRDKGLFWLCGVVTVCVTLLPLVNAALPQRLILLLTAGNADAAGVLRIAVLYFAVAGLLTASQQYFSYIAYPRITRLRLDYCCDVSQKLLGMDYPYTEDPHFYDTYERGFQATSSNNNGIEEIYHDLFFLPGHLLSAFVLAVFLGRYTHWVLPALLAHLVFTLFCAAHNQKYQYSQKEKLARHERRRAYYTRTTQDFSYGKDLRLYGLRERVLANLQKETADWLRLQRALTRHELGWGALCLLTLLASDAVLYGSLIRLVQNGLSIADFSMLLSAALALSGQIKRAAERLSTIRREAMYVEDFYRFRDADLTPEAGKMPALPATAIPSIEFRHVSFHYPGADKNVFTDFSLTIPAGQKLALVGVNGAGKSTFVKLLCGLYRPDAGEILLDGKKIGQWSRAALWQMFGTVFQDVNVFAFTVAENVASSQHDIDRARVWQVLEQVGLADKVRGFEKGIDQPLLRTIEDDGALLSGGEAQKLVIARALYKGGNVVVMDEPTAALDALAEEEIYRQFDALTGGRTSIYISHRLASTRFCDVIALLDADGLAEYGTHAELMAQQGRYWQMFCTQGKYYQKEAAGV